MTGLTAYDHIRRMVDAVRAGDHSTAYLASGDVLRAIDSWRADATKLRGWLQLCRAAERHARENASDALENEDDPYALIASEQWAKEAAQFAEISEVLSQLVPVPHPSRGDT